MCRISVIVPVYNVEDYLRDCVNSILNQSLSDFELILVDDGSTDSSGEICEEYASKYSNVFVIHKENGGQSSARNIGIKKSKGEYLAFVDSDDVIHRDFLYFLYSIIIENYADVAMCHFNKGKEEKWIEEDLKEKGLVIREGQEVLNSLDIDDGPLSLVWNKLYKRDIFVSNNLFFPENLIYEDIYIMPQILHVSKRMVISDKKLYFYRIREGSTTKGFKLKKLDLFRVIEFRIDFLKINAEKRLYIRELEAYTRKLSRYYKEMADISKREYGVYLKDTIERAKKLSKNRDIFQMGFKYKIRLFLLLVFKVGIL